jgi:hypothetical protein
VKLSPVEGQPNGADVTTRELELRPKLPALINAGTTRPGLYQVSLVDHGTDQPIGSDAWILAEGPDDYSAIAASFQKASEQASRLPQEMDPAAVRGLLQAYLESLGNTKREGRL